MVKVIDDSENKRKSLEIFGKLEAIAKSVLFGCGTINLNPGLDSLKIDMPGYHPDKKPLLRIEVRRNGERIDIRDQTLKDDAIRLALAYERELGYKEVEVHLDYSKTIN